MDRLIAGLIRSARPDIVSASKIDSVKVKRLAGVVLRGRRKYAALHFSFSLNTILTISGF